MATKSLDDYKSDINLADFMRQKEYGFYIDEKESTKKFPILRNKDGEKLMVYLDDKKWYRYRDLHSSTRDGTIVDFILSRNGGDFSKVRPTLRSYDGSIVDSSIQVKPATRSAIPKIIAEYNQIIPLQDTSYLKSRGITDETLNAAPFKGTVFNCKHKGFINTAFPVFSEKELVSFDIVAPEKREVASFTLKNNNFEYAGENRGDGLWRSNFDLSRPIDRLIIVEQPINALSHYQMNPNKHNENNVYYATFGQPSHKQVTLISEAHNGLVKTDGEYKHKPGTVSYSYDNDPPGFRHAISQLNKISPEAVCSAEFVKKNPSIAFCMVIPSITEKVNGHVDFIVNCNSKTKGVEVVARLKEEFAELNKQHYGKLAEKEVFSFDGHLFKDNSARVRVNFKNFKDHWKVMFDFIHKFKFDKTQRMSLDLSIESDWNDDLMVSKGIKKATRPVTQDQLDNTKQLENNENLHTIKNLAEESEKKLDINPKIKPANPIGNKWSLGD